MPELCSTLVRVRCAAMAAAIGLLGLQPALGQTATVAGTFGGWSLYTSGEGAQKLCFVATAPNEKKPEGAKRGPVLIYISAWPKDGIRSEISVKQGYPIKAGSKVVVTIGKDTFKLFPKDERAFVADTTQELKLLEAMKKGATLSVAGQSERGTETTDSYSLNGLSQALQSLASTCP